MPGQAELIKRGYAAFARGDMRAVLEFIDPEIEVHEPGGGVEPGVRRSIEGFLASLRNVQEVWEDYGLEPEEIIALGDRFLVRVLMRGTGRGSGVPIHTRVAHLWTIREGRAVKLEMWTDWEEALEAVGLAS
jgi:ketosteroid isomerase-like protein